MTTPTQREALDKVLQAGRRSLHTCFPAKVLAYDAAAQTVDVEPQLMRELEDDEGALVYERLPTLYDVPVQFPRAGGWYFGLPPQPGDFVEIQCAEQSTLAWRDTGVVSEPGISQPHGLNGCIAKPGWYPDTQKIPNLSTTDLVIGKVDGSASIRIKADGSVTLAADAGAEALALARLVDEKLTKLQRAFDNHTHLTAGTGSPTPPTLLATPKTPPGTSVPVGALGSVAASKVRGV
jgi:hypothetical protein